MHAVLDSGAGLCVLNQKYQEYVITPANQEVIIKGLVRDATVRATIHDIVFTVNGKDYFTETCLTDMSDDLLLGLNFNYITDHQVITDPGRALVTIVHDVLRGQCPLVRMGTAANKGTSEDSETTTVGLCSS